MGELDIPPFHVSYKFLFNNTITLYIYMSLVFFLFIIKNQWGGYARKVKKALELEKKATFLKQKGMISRRSPRPPVPPAPLLLGLLLMLESVILPIPAILLRSGGHHPCAVTVTTGRGAKIYRPALIAVVMR